MAKIKNDELRQVMDASYAAGYMAGIKAFADKISNDFPNIYEKTELYPYSIAIDLAESFERRHVIKEAVDKIKKYDIPDDAWLGGKPEPKKSSCEAMRCPRSDCKCKNDKDIDINTPEGCKATTGLTTEEYQKRHGIAWNE